MFINALNKSYDRESCILIVDDDPSLLKFFKIHLNKFFSKIIVVENVAAALKELAARPFDLVISDVRMPKTDGLQLLKKVRKLDNSIPFFMVSGEEMTGEQAVKLKLADAFLKKPFDFDDFHRFISLGIDLRKAFKELSQAMGKDQDIRKILPTKLQNNKKLTSNKAMLTEYFKIIEELKSFSHSA